MATLRESIFFCAFPFSMCKEPESRNQPLNLEPRTRPPPLSPLTMQHLTRGGTPLPWAGCDFFFFLHHTHSDEILIDDAMSVASRADEREADMYLVYAARYHHHTPQRSCNKRQYIFPSRRTNHPRFCPPPTSNEIRNRHRYTAVEVPP